MAYWNFITQFNASSLYILLFLLFLVLELKVSQRLVLEDFYILKFMLPFNPLPLFYFVFLAEIMLSYAAFFNGNIQKEWSSVKKNLSSD